MIDSFIGGLIPNCLIFEVDGDYAGSVSFDEPTGCYEADPDLRNWLAERGREFPLSEDGAQALGTVNDWRGTLEQLVEFRQRVAVIVPPSATY